MPSGMFVMLENLIEGFVHVSTLKGDYYTLGEKTYTLRGKNDKKGYRMGDTVTVKVIAASKNERTIDFELVKNEK
jgi:ribonuclease R